MLVTSSQSVRSRSNVVARSGAPRASEARRAIVLALAVVLLSAPCAFAGGLDLRDLLPGVLLDGITLAPPQVAGATSHRAHFTAVNSQQVLAAEELNDELARQISSYPLTSSAGGFAYTLDPSLGVLTRPTQSFGPIYAERPFTLGKGRYNVGINRSRFTFDHIDDLALREGELAFVFQHVDPGGDGPLNPPFEGDLVTAKLSIRAETELTTFVASFGALDRLDVGVAIPIVDVRLGISTDAHVERLATGTANIHQFSNGTDEQTLNRDEEASGIGDMVFRAKYRLSDTSVGVFALGGDLRLPTGQERDLLGTGATQGTAWLLALYNGAPMATHANIGYAASNKGQADEFLFRVGADVVADSKLTLAADILGNVSKSQKVALGQQDYVYTNPTPPPTTDVKTFSLVTLEEDATRTVLNGSVGFRMNLFQTVLLSGNVLFPLTDTGLTDDLSSLLGVDYSF